MKIKRVNWYCEFCKEAIFSVMRHDMRHCKCGSIFVDGGADYLKFGGKDLTKVTPVLIDLIQAKAMKFKP
jgi:hypothetical protein